MDEKAIKKYRIRRDARIKKRMDAFEENEHPRDENGRFTSGGAGKNKVTPVKDLPSKEAPVRNEVQKISSSKGNMNFKKIGDTAVSGDKKFSMVKRKNGSWDLYHEGEPHSGRYTPVMGESKKVGSFKSFEDAEAAAHEKSAGELWKAWQNDKIKGIDFENSVKDWAEALPEGVTITWGEPGYNEQSVRKTNKGFEFEGKGRIGGKQTFTDNAKDFAERLRNNLSHDLMANDWEDVKIRVKRM